MKIAIIGASTGQLPLCRKAKEMGLETYCFAWEKGAICKNIVDHFFPISIFDTNKIASICKRENIDGVVSNASEQIAIVISTLAKELKKPGVSPEVIKTIKNKAAVRKISSHIPELRTVRAQLFTGEKAAPFYPCLVKPCTGSGKQGVSFVKNDKDFADAIQYAKSAESDKILIEEFIDGNEISVESLSAKGKHFVIQITDKENSGPPHFVELSHHEPSSISQNIKHRIQAIISKLLSAVNYTDGASHIELKVTKTGEIALIEINPRGGGDEISNQLVTLSSGTDYLKGIIEIALGIFKKPTTLHIPQYAGIYFLCAQTKNRLNFFKNADKKSWLVEKKILNTSLQDATSNRNRNGYLIYCADHKIGINE